MRTIENIEKELFAIQQDRMRIINETEARFKKLEKDINELIIADKAQVQLNQLFNKQIIALESQVSVLETHLKKEENKPLITIPERIEIKPKPLLNFFRRK